MQRRAKLARLAWLLCILVVLTAELACGIRPGKQWVGVYVWIWFIRHVRLTCLTRHVRPQVRLGMISLIDVC